MLASMRYLLSAALLALPTATFAQGSVPPTTIPYTYTVDLRSVTQEGDGPAEALSAEIRVDPSQPPGARTQLISSQNADSEMGEEIVGGFRDTIEDADNTPEKMAEGFYCALDPELETQVVSEGPSETVLQVDAASLMMAMQGEDADGMSKRDRKMMEKIARRMDTELRVDRPTGQVRSMAVRLREPVTLMVVAKIRQMEFAQSCTAAPDGNLRSDVFTMMTEAGALGQTMTTTMTVTLRDLQPL